MKIGVIGLGLIGGSLAKAIRYNTEHEVLGKDIDNAVLMRAKLIEAVNGELTDENISECDMVFLALYPEHVISTMETIAPKIKKGAYVIDCAGVKEVVCNAVEPMCEKYDFMFIGGHPMAGIEKSGFIHSKEDMFKNASMILTPYKGVGIDVLDELKKFFTSVGFGNITIKTAEDHDRIIAYTSQLAHVLSSAYIKSDTALDQMGMSAGSFKDMTRVAYLNENMWTELFLDNSKYLAKEIDTLISNLSEYKNAIEAKDAQKLKHLLAEGRKRKELIDNVK